MRKAVLLCAGVLFLMVVSVQSSAGSPDSGFGRKGLFTAVLGERQLQVKPIGVVRAGLGFRAFARVNGDLGVFAYESDGTPDESFGVQGRKLIEVVPDRGADQDLPKAIASQGNKTIVAGGITYVDPSTSYQQLTVTRITRSGEQDRKFGKGGMVRFPDLAPAWGVAVDGQDRIITIGRLYGHRGGPYRGPEVLPQTQIVRLTADGELDRTFGRGGILRLAGQRAFQAWAFSIDVRGRLLLVGTDLNADGKNSRAHRLIRIGRNGKPDRTFGVNGTAEIPAFTFWAKSLLIEGNRIYLGGERASSGSAAILRYTGDGELDPTFGDGGRLETGELHWWGEVRVVGVRPDRTMIAVARNVLLAISEDGLSVEHAADPFSVPNRSTPLVLADGSFVSAPNAGGRPPLSKADENLVTDQEFSQRGLPVEPILAPVSAWFDELIELDDGGLATSSFGGQYGAYLTVGRLTGNGHRKTGFGKRGFKKVPDVDFALGASLIPRSNGRVYALGAPYDRGKTNTLVRFGPSGSYKARLVDGFGTGDISDAIGLPGGRFLAAGGGQGSGKGFFTRYANTFRVARYLPSGAIDRAFGPGGAAQIQGRVDGIATSLTRDRKGRILLAGGICTSMFNCVDKKEVTQMAGVARFLPNGRIDRSFGRRGIVQYRLGLKGYATDVTVLRDGRVAVLATYNCEGHCQKPESILMLMPDGSLDRSFGRRGRIRVGAGRSFWVTGIHAAGRSKVDVAATFEPCGRKPMFSVFRYGRRGQLDRSFGGGDGIIAGDWPNLLGSYGLDSVRQSPGSMTFAGYVERKRGDGGSDVLPAVARLRLNGSDGSSSVKGCGR